MRGQCLSRWPARAALALVVLFVGQAQAWGQAGAETAPLKNGVVLEGSFGKIGKIDAAPAGVPPAASDGPKRIILCDDQLRRVFVGTNQMAGVPVPKAVSAFEKFSIPQRVAVAGGRVGAVGSIVRVTPFDEWGRRIFTMTTANGNVDIVQGITEITPIWTEVKAIQGAAAVVWTMPIATSSIPRDTLSKVLYNFIDPKNSEDRLRIVRLYVQSERIQDARAELDGVIRDFPKLAALEDTAKTLTQMAANRLIREIELREEAGQPMLAIAMLEKFPSDGVAGETQLKVRDMLAVFKDLEKQGLTVTASLDQQLALVKDAKVQAELAPILAEIKTDLTIHTFDRMADYVRLSTDPALSPEQKLSLAVSGWLLGNGGGLDNLAVSKSLVQVRELTRKYLISKRKPERDGLLSEIESLEGATPAYLAKLIAHMKPPLDATPPREAIDPGDIEAILGPKPLPVGPPAPPPQPAAAPAAVDAEAKPCGEEPAPKKAVGILDSAPTLPKLPGLAPRKDPAVVPAAAIKDEPAQPAPANANGNNAPPATPTGIPGLFEQTVVGLPEEPEIKYYVQLPPEYSPYRRYPCIVTLNGAGTTPLQQIDWWAGQYNPEARARYGQATRHGYIVIAPRWIREHQREYGFSSREHAATLYSLRDACKRFAIDTDRVFLSGHSMGGDAAWDIGLAHPDLWAGVAPIVAKADKYVSLYWKNAEFVSFYFVWGERDGNKLAQNGPDWDRYLTHSGFDTMIVQYQGRGHEHFHDEIQKLFEWMNLHRRNFFPREFITYTMRPWDSFFWWTDVSKLPPAAVVLPEAWPPKNPNPMEIKAKILETNSVTLSTGAGKATVWLSPDMVSFDSPVKVTINNRRQLNVTPSVKVLLEDVRTRGDRQHPFWAKAESQ